MSIRRTIAVLAAVCALAPIAAVSAVASTSHAKAHGRTAVAVKSLSDIAVTGTAVNHKKFTGTFSVQRFVSRGGTSYAVGSLTGKIGQRTVHRNNVAIPVTVASGTGGAHDAATCPILHLDLGPVNLNLLGLQVHLNRVVLDITAVSGPGNLLGNLLCSVSNLLNGSGLPLSEVTGLLNILNTVLGDPALLKL